MPRRGIETDQLDAFFFEAVAFYKGIPFTDFVKCLITDMAAAGEAGGRITTAGWINRVNPGADSLFVTASTGRARMLASLLPIFEYKFAPDAFLAGFDDVAPGHAVAAAIRIAAIMSCETDRVLPRFDVQQLAIQIGVPYKTTLEALFALLAASCRIPSRLIWYGGIWLDLVAWHAASIQLKNYHELNGKWGS
ncbi:hypothetical protein AK830_g6683 [Neonectria ditissima]|uniref:Uncharacterized protein n=1 Tax=Neonectria ditissima TaxID=78410 RepID=A0A0P7BHE7_9HYPO|nr:hypothetical protein AK830_g6683 [Neonectria ditissima]